MLRTGRVANLVYRKVTVLYDRFFASRPSQRTGTQTRQWKGSLAGPVIAVQTICSFKKKTL